MTADQTTPQTALAIHQSLKHQEARLAVETLLRRLKKFVMVMPCNSDAEMPMYDIRWATEYDDGPEKAIHEAVRLFPQLWADALPETVCIVPRSDLKNIGLSDDLIKRLASLGGHLVHAHSAQYRHMLNALKNGGRGE